MIWRTLEPAQSLALLVSGNAGSVEGSAFNPLVAGSSPARPTNPNNNLRRFRQVGFR
jgi:hypothetical protein